MQVEAYVVVSDDDMLADHNGKLPEALKNDAEWAFFQAGLNRSDVTILGRRSHEATPNHKHRRRIVMTRSVKTTGAIDQDHALFWNPAETDLADALAVFETNLNHLAVVGGQAVFDYFLAGPFKYTAFHLSRVHGVQLPGGRGVFAAVNRSGKTAKAVLEARGFIPEPVVELDEGVDVVTWRQNTA